MRGELAGVQKASVHAPPHRKRGLGLGLRALALGEPVQSGAKLAVTPRTSGATAHVGTTVYSSVTAR